MNWNCQSKRILTEFTIQVTYGQVKDSITIQRNQNLASFDKLWEFNI